jgi:hypothetical protein
MTTPYGTTSFDFGASNAAGEADLAYEYCHVTEADGGQQMFMFAKGNDFTGQQLGSHLNRLAIGVAVSNWGRISTFDIYQGLAPGDGLRRDEQRDIFARCQFVVGGADLAREIPDCTK